MPKSEQFGFRTDRKSLGLKQFQFRLDFGQISTSEIGTLSGPSGTFSSWFQTVWTVRAVWNPNFFVPISDILKGKNWHVFSLEKAKTQNNLTLFQSLNLFYYWEKQKKLLVEYYWNRKQKTNTRQENNNNTVNVRKRNVWFGKWKIVRILVIWYVWFEIFILVQTILYIKIFI